MIGVRVSAGVLCVAVATSMLCAAGEKGETTPRLLRCGGRQRSYLLHVPPGAGTAKALPLVLVFHGGGGDGRGTERLTGFSRLSDRHGFLVAYPEGLWRNWNDGRADTVSRAHREKIDDLAFVRAMLDEIAAAYHVDPKRVYSTGISNGGIFSHYLAASMANRIAAIAPVVGGIPEPFVKRFAPSEPVSVLIIQGTDDPLTPYRGGPIARGKRGRIVDTARAAELWRTNNGSTSEPSVVHLPDTDPEDGCTARVLRWPRGRNATEVVVYIMEGGGHTWPGGAQYLPRFLIGRVCRDFDGTETIWNFFASHPKH